MDITDLLNEDGTTDVSKLVQFLDKFKSGPQAGGSTGDVEGSGTGRENAQGDAAMETEDADVDAGGGMFMDDGEPSHLAETAPGMVARAQMNGKSRHLSLKQRSTCRIWRVRRAMVRRAIVRRATVKKWTRRSSQTMRIA
jgi:hypothetical protein